MYRIISKTGGSCRTRADAMTKLRNLPIDGLTVTRISVDDSLTLFCRAGDRREAEIRIDGAFAYVDPAGEAFTGCIEESPRGAGPVLELVFARIAAARIDETGALELSFAGDAVLTAEAENHFVSWEIKTSNGFHAVCLADRDVVVKDIA